MDTKSGIRIVIAGITCLVIVKFWRSRCKKRTRFSLQLQQIEGHQQYQSSQPHQRHKLFQPSLSPNSQPGTSARCVIPKGDRSPLYLNSEGGHEGGLLDGYPQTPRAAVVLGGAYEQEGDEKLEQLFRELDISEYLENFLEERVCLEDLVRLSKPDTEILIPQIGPRSRLVEYIRSRLGYHLTPPYRHRNPRQGPDHVHAMQSHAMQNHAMQTHAMQSHAMKHGVSEDHIKEDVSQENITGQLKYDRIDNHDQQDNENDDPLRDEESKTDLTCLNAIRRMECEDNIRLDSDAVRMILDFWSLVTPAKEEQLGKDLFDALFTAHPSYHKLFATKNMKTHGLKVVRMFSRVITRLESPTFIEELYQVAHLHVNLSVPLKAFQHMWEALDLALRFNFPDCYQHRVRTELKQMYQHICNIFGMIYSLTMLDSQNVERDRSHSFLGKEPLRSTSF